MPGSGWNVSASPATTVPPASPGSVPGQGIREIKRLLAAIYCPKEVAVMHCKGYRSKVAKGNELADCQTRKWHFTKPLHCRCLWSGQVLWNRKKPQYIEEELERYERRGAKTTDKGWLESEDGWLIIPENAHRKILKNLHQSFHIGVESTYQMASHFVWR